LYGWHVSNAIDVLLVLNANLEILCCDWLKLKRGILKLQIYGGNEAKLTLFGTANLNLQG
jgi:hypothetical protein